MIFDTCIVLGHVQFKKRQSSRQKKRLDKAVKLYRSGEINSIITTGGFGMFNRTDKALAKWAKDYLVDQGIPFSRVYIEDTSTNTVENAVFSLAIMKKRNLNSAVIVTSVDHMPRSKAIFREIFPNKIKMKFVISDYHWGLLTLWDLAWQTLGILKYIRNRKLK